MPKYLLHVPQGGYGEIDPRAGYDGIYTDGIDTCGHVIVMNRATQHIILCHADAITDLSGEAGMAGWIEKICPEKDYGNLYISIEKGQEFKTPEGDTVPCYYDRVKSDILRVTSINEETLTKSGILKVDNHDSTYGIGVMNTGEIVNVHPQGYILTTPDGKIYQIGTPSEGYEYICKNSVEPYISNRVLRGMPPSSFVPPIPINRGDTIRKREELEKEFSDLDFSPRSSDSRSRSSSKSEDREPSEATVTFGGGSGGGTAYVPGAEDPRRFVASMSSDPTVKSNNTMAPPPGVGTTVRTKTPEVE